MKAVVQRVKSANLWVDGKQVSAIDKGLVVYLGVQVGDVQENAYYLAKKIANMLFIFTSPFILFLLKK